MVFLDHKVHISNWSDLWLTTSDYMYYMLVKLWTPTCFLSILEPRENHFLDMWLWESQFTFLSLCCITLIWELTISSPPYFQRVVGRIKLAQTSTFALKHAKHNRNKSEFSMIGRHRFKRPRFLKERLSMGCGVW